MTEIKNRYPDKKIIDQTDLSKRRQDFLFGIQYDFSEIQTGIATVITAIFGLLTVLGIVTDHTTDGFSDSDQALTYTEPKK